jgi:hypothetical protein
MIAVVVPRLGRKPCKESSKLMALVKRSLMIMEITFQIVSKRPIPLVPPSGLGNKTKVEKARHWGMFPVEKNCCIRVIRLFHLV